MKHIIVDIVLASYNGEAFIGQQIESILNQTHGNFNLYITDDGSKDNTVNIIKYYSAKDDRVKLVSKERTGGVNYNFERGLKFSQGNYIFLSDQDDIWYPNKIEEYLKSMLREESIEKNVPILLYSDLKLVDSSGNGISESFYKSSGLNPLRNYHYLNLKWMGSVMGCTIMLNKIALQHALPFPHPIIMHDHWLALSTLKAGKILYIDKAFMDYRQHNNNVSGGMGFQRNIFNKLFNTKNYINIYKRAKIISSMYNTNNIFKRIKFLYSIFPSFKNCETIKYPLIFSIIYTLFG